jgi:hypothetical protein
VKFQDLSLAAQHQLLVNFTISKMALLIMSDPPSYLQLSTLLKGKTSLEDWAKALGELASQEVRSISEEKKNKIIQQLDEAIIFCDQLDKPFLLIIDE